MACLRGGKSIRTYPPWLNQGKTSNREGLLRSDFSLERKVRQKKLVLELPEEQGLRAVFDCDCGKMKVMKQRIRVVGIVRKGEEVLLLKRAGGRAEVVAGYELPTGKIHFGEQPEEAMARIIYDYLGNRTELVELLDAVTFVDLNGASELANLYIVYKVGFEGDSVKITTERYNAYKWATDEEIGSVQLDEASLSVLEIVRERQKKAVKGVGYRREVDAATVFVDGGSRGNPGPSGVGYYIVAANGTVLKRGGEFLGFSTSRLAEYYGLKEGIE